MATGQATVDEIESAAAAYQGARAGFFSVLWRQTLVSHLLVATASALFLAIGSVLVIEGQLSLGQLVAADIVVALLAQNLTKMPKLFEKYYELGAALAKIDSAAAPLPLPRQEPVRPMRIAVRLTGALLVLAVLALIFVPWQQTAFSSGRVISYAPIDRQQTIEAPIEGRIVRWYVQEGQAVKAGDRFVDISDNDPEILNRLADERAAVERRFEATRRRALAIEERIAALGMSKANGVSAAGARVVMAEQRVISAERALEAARATVNTTNLNYERQKRLLTDGLAAARTVELAELDHQRALVEVERAIASVTGAKEDLVAISGDKQRVGSDASAQLNDAQAGLGAAEAELASTSAELARIDVRLSRQLTQEVKVPRDGFRASPHRQRSRWQHRQSR